ncbi:MAG: CARDB domain-containing protein [Chitinophagaceae bacterium]
MKKIILFLLVQAFIASTYAQDPDYPTPPAAAQNIIRAEYFIDTDPGQGNGTSITLTPGIDLSNVPVTINVNGLTNGVHRLYIRALNGEGKWSLTNVKDFLYDSDFPYGPTIAAAQNIVAAEYFIDTDPGTGAGTAISITPGLDLSNVSVVVNTASLTNGTHRLYIRAKSAEGRWSLTNVKDFIVDFDFNYPGSLTAALNVVAAEYFIDTDPGIGNATAIPITPGLDLATVNATLNTSTLAVGTHRLYIRAKSAEGRWSLTNVKDFLVDMDFNYPSAPVATLNVVAAEYFIDTDPGFGNGTAISISAGTDLSNIAVAANTSTLAIGTHRLYIRAKNQEGSWSLTGVKDFIVNTDFGYPEPLSAALNIVAAEYFIDTDPGFGAATPVTITPGTNLSNVPVTVNTSGLSNGKHNFYLRTRNQEGRWSLTAQAQFYTDLMAITPDTIKFGNVPISEFIEKNVVITNNSSTAQTITAIAAGTGFTTNETLPITINAGTSDTIAVRFSPTNITTYVDSVVFTTSAGKYRSVLTGTGIAQVPSWSIDPASGYNYGNVALNAGSTYNFVIRNTGNIPVTLSSVTTDNSAFVPTFTTGTVIAANSTINLPVVFTPTSVQAYSSVLKIRSSTAGVDSVTTTVWGNGYAPGTPPTLEYVPGGVYGGTSGVDPAVGQTGIYTYKILYKSANNKAPMAGYPKVSIDLNGDQDFNDLNEGTFTMTKEGNSTDYVTGVVYTFTYTHNNNTSTAGYAFEVKDEDGNAATAGIAYKSGPVVTNDILDLRIFANDISFSNSNPQPGQSFTMTARISNSTAVPATNIPIKFYRDTILIGSDVLPAVSAFGSSTISRTFNFAEEGFYPIKVWIDSSRTLNESNVLNNYAIRPVTVGSPNLPGGITVTTSASRQECPQLQVLITGHAEYFGTGASPIVAGAEVTINTGAQTFKTTTDANGNYSIVVTGVTCGSGNFAYAVTVTDFTFTSSAASNSIPMPCPAPNACKPPTAPPSQGGVVMRANTSPCSNIAGTTPNANFEVTLKSRDVNNFWCAFDYINDRSTLYVFYDDVLAYTKEYGHGLSPGQTISENIPIPLPSGSTTPVKVTVLYSYTYVEFSSIPSSTYYGHFINITERAELSVQPELNLPDLTIQNFRQTNFTSFSFDEANQKCGDAGAHTVKVFDSIPGGSATLIKTVNVTSLEGGKGITISHSDANFTPGTHIIKVIADADAQVAETDESNNEFFFTITVVAPDITVGTITASPTLMNTGSGTQFTAVVKNTGKETGTFHVQFSVNGTQVGSQKTISLGQNDSVKVTSDTYTVTSAINSCGETVTVFADAGNDVTESAEGNNTRSIVLSADLTPFQLPNETGSSSNPAIVRINTNGNFFPALRNMGIRDAANVKLRYLLNGVEIGKDSFVNVKAGISFASHGAFTHMFDATGDFVIQVIADEPNDVCESNEANNTGTYHIRVTDSKPDLEVLSQFISPSSLNPHPAYDITIVGTVRNSGGKVSTPNVLRFFVDDVQLGDDVPFNAILPGKDTTVQATVTYSSLITGVKTLKIVADPNNTMDEEREDNNVATRTIIVGEAPDMARRFANAIRFNPGGFTRGDSVIVSYSIINNGTVDGTAWVKFFILDEANSIRAVDSTQFTLAAGAFTTVSKKMLFDVIKGTVIAQVVGSDPIEYDLLNNSDTLAFSTIIPLTRNLIINANLDMKQGIQDQLPGWIGGKLLLGDHDLVVNGSILNIDTAHFIVTNGTGKLKLVNNNAENIFPVATDISHANFVKLNNAGTPDNFSVRVVPYVLKNGNNGDTVKTGNVNRTWFIEEETTGGSNATVTFFWNEQDEQPSFDRTVSKAAHYTTSWQYGSIGAAIIDTAGRYTRSQSGYTSFSPFTVNSVDAALPLHLLQFNVTARNNDALLKWQTTDEVNTSNYSIEHSIDGINFTAIGKVAAANTSGTHDYQYVHTGIGKGNHYYRLKMIDIDGSFTYSEVKMIRLAAVITLQAYPNPAHEAVTVKGLEAGGTLELITLTGKTVYRTATTDNSAIISLSSIANGVYFIRYINHNQEMQQLKIVKQ